MRRFPTWGAAKEIQRLQLIERGQIFSARRRPALCAIAHWDRAIQYSRAVAIEPTGCGVLDSPLSRGMTGAYRAAGITMPEGCACALGPRIRANSSAVGQESAGNPYFTCIVFTA